MKREARSMNDNVSAGRSGAGDSCGETPQPPPSSAESSPGEGSVPSVECPVPSAKENVLSAEESVLGAEEPVLSAEGPVSSAEVVGGRGAEGRPSTTKRK